MRGAPADVATVYIADYTDTETWMNAFAADGRINIGDVRFEDAARSYFAKYAAKK